MSASGKLVYLIDLPLSATPVLYNTPAATGAQAFHGISQAFRGTNAKLIKKFIKSVENGESMFGAPNPSGWGKRAAKRQRRSADAEPSQITADDLKAMCSKFLAA